MATVEMFSVCLLGGCATKLIHYKNPELVQYLLHPHKDGAKNEEDRMPACLIGQTFWDLTI